MKQIVAVLIAGALVSLLVACGSDEAKQDAKDQGTQMGQGQMSESAQGEEGGHMAMKDAKELPSSEDWIRHEPIDVKALDTDKDGFVYQGEMHWNVIADSIGRCPTCGMTLKKVSVAEAMKNLQDNGFTTTGGTSSGDTKN